VAADAATRAKVDALLGFDPGLNQASIALGAAAAIGVSIGVLYLFAQITHAMWVEPGVGAGLTPAVAAQLHAQHHAESLLTMLMGGLIGVLVAFCVADTNPRGLGLTMALAPVPMLAAMALAIPLVHERSVGVIVMAIVMGVGVWMPKLGPAIGGRAFLFGQLLFVGYLIGFLSDGAIKEGQLGWVAVILWTAAVVNFLLKLLVFAPLSRGAMRRTIRAFFARGRGVIAAAADLYSCDSPGARRRARRRLRQRLVRLNEAALIIDGMLGDHPEIAHEMHERLFDAELALHNIAHAADELSGAPLPPELRSAVAASLAQARGSDDQFDGQDAESLPRMTASLTAQLTELEAGRVACLASALGDWRAALRRWNCGLTPGSANASHEPFESPVRLVFGNLAGSSQVSGAAAEPTGSRRSRFKLDAFAQAGLRIAVAVLVASALGSILSERRFYWAVIAVFVSFVGANTGGEQIIKALNRVLGTVVGIYIGSLLAHAVGPSAWSAAVIIAALSVGAYFIRVSYALMAIGVTITVSQLYMQLGEYSNGLLTLRLEETAIGAGVAALVALLVFPVPTSRATRIAARDYLASLGELLEQVTNGLRSGRVVRSGLSSSARGLDHAAQQLLSTAQPLSLSPFQRAPLEHNLRLFEQASYHASSLAAHAQGVTALTGPAQESAIESLSEQRTFVATLEHLLDRLAAVGKDEQDTAALADELRRRGDMLPAMPSVTTGAGDSLLLQHVTGLDETLTQLGHNLARRR
jgi:hypothetical protein